MSNVEKHPHEAAAMVAHSIVAELSPYCKRIQIAGSIRRAEVEVGDIEIVAQSRPAPTIPDLFGGGLPGTPPLLEKLSRLMEAKEIKHSSPRRWGTKYRSFWRLYEVRPGGRLTPFKVDIFIATPETWPVILTIRTGGREFSQWLVSPQVYKRTPGGKADLYNGALPPGYRIKEGRLLKDGRPVDLEDEGDLFKEIGIPWIPLPTRSNLWEAISIARQGRVD